MGGSRFSVEPVFRDQIQLIPVGLEANKIFLPEAGCDSCPVCGEWDGGWRKRAKAGKFTVFFPEGPMAKGIFRYSD